MCTRIVAQFPRYSAPDRRIDQRFDSRSLGVAAVLVAELWDPLVARARRDSSLDERYAAEGREVGR
jgi:hypothetical protein